MRHRLLAALLASAALAAPAPALPAGPAPSALEDGRAAISAKDYAKALALLRPLADAGEPGAQNAIGVLYQQGWGVERDVRTAATWFRRAAEQGEVMAQFNLGTFHAEGHGVPKDPLEAASWWSRAAEQGYPLAQVALGTLYGRGEGVPLDSARALGWYRKAADQGHAGGQLGVGDMILNGEGVRADPVEARRWFELAAAQGHPLGHFRVAYLHLAGLGTPRDLGAAARSMASAVERWRATSEGVPQVVTTEGPEDTRNAHLLLRAMDAPADALADSLLAVQSQLVGAQWASAGANVIMGWDQRFVRLDASNGQEYVERVEARILLYSAAARQRGVRPLAGDYEATLRGGCERLGFVAGPASIAQDGAFFRLANGQARDALAHRGATAESTLAMTHGFGDEIRFTGAVVEHGRIELRHAGSDCIVTLSKKI